ncbi:MAG: NADH-quinone oxidoreductase subunit M [Bacteroidota bacterium]|nr:NADH-quinone oxidoreductase subunit M [Bacteroidota bacterium]MXW14106.1 NADH-quinone oxidoreductase subunit M [Rhodothermaceae bacterium]MDE2645912.1 NADH-quinone oxidoreductase subunit M [Bacteroidota bacterium]MXW33735.1 NADH-quinone oxidoreductase subunit M [Rhodothermaceae bacterium]MXZ18729.1 NADH-quinone oxidoreductase subunit M [Rhodothermaceae bacterium]
MEFANLLTAIIFLPLVGALCMLFAPSDRSVRWFALLVALGTFLLSLPLWFGFDVANAADLQFRGVEFPLISESLDIRYLIGIDGFSLLLLLLTTFLGPIVVLCSWTYIKENIKGYYVLLLVLQTGMTGVFCAFDVLLFYIFFELTLIPMYFLIGIWGGERRIYAAIKFVIYTMAGSLLMLVAILYLGYAAGNAVNDGVFTTNYFKLLAFNVPLGMQTWLFVLFAFAFAIKVPVFPFHTWLPDAHVQAPTGGSVILAGVLLKMGTYGLIRFCLPFFPSAAVAHTLLIGILAVIGIVYGALVSRAQTDAKKLVAYSSVSHLGFVVLGIFALTLESIQGAMIQMINHGISTGALFLIVGMLYERRHTRLMSDYGGIAKSVPVLTFFMVLTALASAGLPGLNGFVGEFLILVGAFSSEAPGMPVLTIIATTGVILAAVYLLWMLSRMFFGPLTTEANRNMSDLNRRELVILAPMALLMILLGLMPQPFLKVSEPAATRLIEVIEEKRAYAEIDDADLQRTYEMSRRSNRSSSSPSPTTHQP